MSINSWKKEFYSIPAESECLDTDLKRIDHSLQKWVGLLPENLKKHGINKILHSSRIEDSKGDTFLIDSESCALCFEYLFPSNKSCHRCPLYLVNESTCCDQSKEIDSFSPYGEFSWKENPKPMIQLLIETRELVGKDKFEESPDFILNIEQIKKLFGRKEREEHTLVKFEEAEELTLKRWEDLKRRLEKEDE